MYVLLMCIYVVGIFVFIFENVILVLCLFVYVFFGFEYYCMFFLFVKSIWGGGKEY